MELFLNGRTAIVTGGTRGIGIAIAEALARHGARIAICGRSQDSTASAIASLRNALSVAAPGSRTTAQIIGQTCDVRSRDSVRSFFEFVDLEFGGPSIVVNNAGVGAFAPIAELSVEDWSRVIETNLTGVFHVCQEALIRFRKSGGGSLIQIGSLAGKNPFAGGAAYNASKFGLNGFAEAMMLDHRHDNVRVSTILPGSVDTEFSPRSAGKSSDWKIAPADIAEIVLAILRMPPRTLISAVEVRPARPPKA